ncbi:MAG: ABC transporter ATP-binding protein [Rhodoblastus sp.]|nr:ABC transporter ATP-binding protein [Rhodoblastus sp.]MCB9997910.1 ABC transporter ATP-binding protein [Methylobacteriaceae bacterium]HPG04543.1 ABC transporter ATP-binding protein [Rhodoblastus sp.]
MSANSLLEARAIDAFYGASHVLRGVDFRVGRGETVSLLGRNGMGKTTLLRTLMGLVPARGGEIRFDGDDIKGRRPSAVARAGVGFVPEGRGIFPNLSVEENLIFAEREGPGGRRDWTREAIYQLFPRLLERRANWGNQLSGGEQQMLTIGRALMSNPTLLMVDEATEGLAPMVREDIWRTLRLIAERGVAIVVVDKNLDDLKKLCRRHVILVKGEVVFDGPTGELAARDDFVRSQLGL